MLPVGSDVPSDTYMDYKKSDDLLKKMRDKSAGFIMDSIGAR